MLKIIQKIYSSLAGESKFFNNFGMLIALAIIISLSLIVFFHELGHFIIGRLFKIKIEEFGIGYPPRFFGIVKTGNKRQIFLGKNVPQSDNLGTIYSLNWVPFGGFNRFKGELAGTSQDQDSLTAQKWWKKFLVVLGGAGMNVVLAAILLSLVSFLGSYQEITPELLNTRAVVKDISIRFISIAPNSPALRAGLEANDRLISLDNQTFQEISEVQNYFKQRIDQNITIKVERQKSILDISIIPKSAKEIFGDNSLEGGAIGVIVSKMGRVYYPWYLALWNGIVQTGNLVWLIIKSFYLFFKELIFYQKFIGEATGVVGLAAMTADAAKVGIIYLMQFVATISLLIAITQLIPFPALDGGRAVFFLIEGPFRRPVKPSIENAINNIGFSLLLLLIIYVTYKDIIKLGQRFIHN